MMQIVTNNLKISGVRTAGLLKGKNLYHIYKLQTEEPQRRSYLTQPPLKNSLD